MGNRIPRIETIKYLVSEGINNPKPMLSTLIELLSDYSKDQLKKLKKTKQQ